MKIKITNQNKRKSDVNSSIVFFGKYKPKKKQPVNSSDETFKYTNQIANQNFVSQCEKKNNFSFRASRCFFFSTLLSSSVCCNTHSIHVVLL